MNEHGAFGTTLRDAFHLSHAPALVTRAVRRTRLSVTELRYDAEGFGMTSPMPREDAYLVALQLNACANHELWNDDRPVPVTPIVGGETMIYDLRRAPVARIQSPFHSLHFYVPRAALDTVADDAGAPRVDELDCRPGVRMNDPVVTSLVSCIRPALREPEQVSDVFADHVLLALCLHVARAYGHMRIPANRARGGLAPWQERRAKEMLSANLAGNVSLALLAGECGLSPSHFTRAFRQSTGVPPHRWLLLRRIDRAKELLHGSALSLAEIALACGFADQSHFTRVFSTIAGRSPGASRRLQKV